MLSKGGIFTSFKIVFCDIDGTLLDSHKQLLPSSIKAVQQLCKNNILFVPISARMPKAIVPITDQMNIKTPIISYNGGLILSEDNKTLYSRYIPIQFASDILEKISSRWPEAAVNYYADDNWYVEDISADAIQTEMKNTGTTAIEKKFTSLLNDNVIPYKIMCIVEPSICEEMEKELSKAYPELSVIRSAPYLLEIVDKSVTKGNAVNIFMSLYNILPEQAIAFGDNYNDTGMLTEVGFSVVMGNAPQDVKKLASKVTSSNDDDGIYNALLDMGLISV